MMRLSFKEMKDAIAKIVPKDIQYEVDLEAGDISIVTPTPDAFGGGDGLVGKIAKKKVFCSQVHEERKMI